MARKRSASAEESTVKASSQRENTYFEEKRRLLQAEKEAVAQFVVDNIIGEGDSILLDAGTSLFPIASEIARKTQSSAVSKTHYTIMTHNYEAFNILVDQVEGEAHVNIVLAGGRYDRDLNALFGPQTIRAYEDFYPRVVVMGISGMVANIGLFCHGNTEELAVKEVIFKKSELARDRIIIADHTKLGLPDALCFGRSDRLGGAPNCRVVTGEPPEGAAEAQRRLFESERQQLESRYGVKVEVVKVRSEGLSSSGAQEGQGARRR
jgi:DeoR/GlpR family transcriptional regulator of sugar metabolism